MEAQHLCTDQPNAIKIVPDQAQIAQEANCYAHTTRTVDRAKRKTSPGGRASEGMFDLTGSRDALPRWTPKHPIAERFGKEFVMQYARLGNTGLFVSRLAFGNMTFGSDPRFPLSPK